MLDIHVHVHVFPKVNILAVRGELTVNKSIINLQKYHASLFFSHVAIILFLGIQVARETKKQVTVTATM